MLEQTSASACSRDTARLVLLVGQKYTQNYRPAVAHFVGFWRKPQKRYAMKKRTTTAWGLLLVSLFGCQSGGSDSPEVAEIAAGPNAQIIRNPVTANHPVDSSAVAQLQFEAERHDFGEVPEGQIVEHTFRFTNTGQVPLLITDARSTCGCTVPEWPEEPIPPGEQGLIMVRFNTEGKLNQQQKPITITANTLPAQTRIYLEGFVVPAK